MNQNTNRFFSSTRPMIIVAIVFFFLLLFQMIHREIIIYNNDRRHFEEALFDEIKERLSIELNSRIEEFDYIINQTDGIALSDMHDTLESFQWYYLYLKSELSLDEAELRRLLIDMTMSLSDEVVLEIYTAGENKEMLTVVGDSVVAVPFLVSSPFLGHEDTLTLLNIPDFQGHWTHEKDTQLIVRLDIDDTYELLMMASLESVVAVVFNDVVEQFIAYYEENDETIFLISVSGDIHLHSSTDYMGRNLYEDLDDELFKSTFTFIKENLHETEGVFLSYPFYLDETRTEVVERVGYLLYYEPFDLVMGKSVPITVLEPFRTEFRTLSLQTFYRLTLPMYILTYSTALLGGYIIYRYAKASSLTILEEEALFKKIASLSNQLIVITDKDNRILYSNPIGNKVLGRRQADYERPLDDRLQETPEGTMILQGIKQDYFVHITRESITYRHQEANLHFFEDITETVKQEQDLRRQSDTDALTQLYNRRRLMHDFHESILKHVEAGNVGAFAIIDFDNFKRVNDVHGHEYGDTVLKQVAEIFKAYCDDCTVYYRIGGDEFAVLSKQPKESVIAILKAVKQEIQAFDFRGLRINFTYGIVDMSANDRFKRFSDYYSQADERLYHYKSRNKDNASAVR